MRQWNSGKLIVFDVGCIVNHNQELRLIFVSFITDWAVQSGAVRESYTLDKALIKIDASFLFQNLSKL